MEQKITCVGLLCQKVEIEETTGFLSLIKIISSVQVTVSPEELKHVGVRAHGIKTPIDFVLVWDRTLCTENEKDEIHFNCDIEFCDPHNTIHMSDMKLEVVIPAGVDRHYSIFNFSRGVVTSRPGRHIVRVTSSDVYKGNSVVLCEQPLYIHMVSQDGKSIIDA